MGSFRVQLSAAVNAGSLRASRECHGECGSERRIFASTQTEQIDFRPTRSHAVEDLAVLDLAVLVSGPGHDAFHLDLVRCFLL